MKKIVSFLMVIVMLISILSMNLSVSAAFYTKTISDTSTINNILNIVKQNDGQNIYNKMYYIFYNSQFAAAYNKTFPYPNSGSSYNYVIDNGTKYILSGYSRGCYLYADYVSNYVYGFSSHSNKCTSRYINSSGGNMTTDQLKQTILKYAQAGEHIFVAGNIHSVAFVAYDNNGFYYTDYNSDSNPKIYVHYTTWEQFKTECNSKGQRACLLEFDHSTNDTSTTHTHNYSIHEYESAHPHKYYKKCSCGDFYYTGETAKVSNCPDCVDIKIQNTGIENITDTNAYLKSVIYKPASSSLQRIGVKIRREGKTYTEEWKFYKIDTTTPSINKNQVELNWNLTNDCGYELIHATKYYYMMYAIIDGEKYWSEEASFTTTGSHIYSNACDTSCNDCGKTRTVPDHIYTDDFDESCNECGYVREIEKQYYYYYDWTFDFDKTMRLLSDVIFNDGSMAEFMREFKRGQIKAIQVISDTEVVHPDAPERPGYKFTGWKVLAEQGDSFYDITINDTYLQAQYEPLSCKDGEIPHSYTDIYDADCNECGEVRDVPNRDWQVSVNTTGVYNITPSKALSGFNKDSITVLDKNGKTVKYNNIKNGWPLVTGQNYTLKLNTEFENINDLSWNLTKNSATIFPDTSASGWYNDAVTYAVGAGIMSGYSNGKFGTSDSIKRQDFLVMLARLDGVNLETYKYKSSFPDVARNSYYEAAVNWGAQKGIVTGYQNGKFGVGDKVTREQLVTFLYRYAKYKGYDSDYSSNRENVVSRQYKDYKNVSGFAKQPILWAIEKGVISGKTSSTIVPQGNAQRCEVAKIMYNIYLNDIFK